MSVRDRLTVIGVTGMIACALYIYMGCNNVNNIESNPFLHFYGNEHIITPQKR